MKEEILKNPILEAVKASISKTQNRLCLAVPFITSYARKVLNCENLELISDKRCVTRFDDSNLLSFDIPTLRYLLECGFEIRYNNYIHLKLYVTDNDTYVSSSNLTQSGFESKIELTVRVDDFNKSKCLEIFDEIWASSECNKIDLELLLANQSKYDVLKKQQANKIINSVTSVDNHGLSSDDEVEIIIQEILNLNRDYTIKTANTYQANKLRNKKLGELMQGFNSDLFYLPKGNPERNKTLFYDFSYGYEAALAGTGLREEQFKSAFTSNEFKKVVEFICPEIVDLKPWNSEDDEEKKQFCKGIFDFEIPSYKEAIPIRLASYFHPNYFMPIFKLEHFKKICSDLGFNSNTTEKGVNLFEYNKFAFQKLRNLPYDTYIKSDILYLILYTLESRVKANSGKSKLEIISNHSEKWKKELVIEGLDILERMKLIK